MIPIARGEPVPDATESAPLNIAGGALLLAACATGPNPPNNRSPSHHNHWGQAFLPLHPRVDGRPGDRLRLRLSIDDLARGFAGGPSIELELMWSNLRSVVTEQARAMQRTAFSPVVREAGDRWGFRPDQLDRWIQAGLNQALIAKAGL